MGVVTLSKMSCNVPFLPDRLVALEHKLAEHIHMRNSTIKIQHIGLFDTSVIQNDLKAIESRIAFVRTEIGALKQCFAGAAPKSKA